MKKLIWMILKEREKKQRQFMMMPLRKKYSKGRAGSLNSKKKYMKRNINIMKILKEFNQIKRKVKRNRIIMQSHSVTITLLKFKTK